MSLMQIREEKEAGESLFLAALQMSSTQVTEERWKEWVDASLPASVQLLLTSCARHPSHYKQDNTKSN